MRLIAFFACGTFACSSYESLPSESFDGDGVTETGGSVGDGDSESGSGGEESAAGGSTSESGGAGLGGEAPAGGTTGDGGSPVESSGGAQSSGGTASGGALIEECPLWYIDADEDGFGDPEVSEESCVQLVGYVDNGDDCYDDNDLAFPRELFVSVPGVPNWFYEDRGDGSFDYNCDGEVRLEHNYGNCPDGEVTNGWAFAAPECGGEAGWKSSCNGGGVYPRDQGCI